MSDEHFAGGHSSKRLPRRVIKQMKYQMKRIPHKLKEIQTKESQHDSEKANADQILDEDLKYIK